MRSLGFYVAVAFGASFIHDCFYQRRPVCWCLEKEPPRPPHYPFWFKSIFHSHDIPSVRRGYEVYRKVSNQSEARPTAPVGGIACVWQLELQFCPKVVGLYMALL